MSEEATQAAPAPAKPARTRAASTEPKAPASKEFSASITIKFGPKEEATHKKILADADEDDRQPNEFLSRWLRQYYPTPKSEE